MDLEALLQDAEEIDFDVVLAKRSFRDFVEMSFPVIEPKGRFVPGWHIDCVCDHLQAVVSGEIQDLLINIPPGHMKSMLGSVLLPAWLWTEPLTKETRYQAGPETRFMGASYGYDLAVRDSLLTAKLVNSDWYQARWPNVGVSGANTHTISTIYRGFRMATSIGGAVTGKHVHYQLIDDPLKAGEGMSAAAREAAWSFIGQTLSTRLLPGGKRICIMQRLHEDDPAGHMLRDGGWTHLCLPEEYEPKRTFYSPLGWVDPRKQEGDLLWPDFFSARDHDARKKALGSYGTAGQLQQRPAPEEGGVIKRNVFRVYTELPAKFDMTWQSWDSALSNTNDPWAGGAFGSIGNDIYLLPGFVNALLTFPQAIEAMKLKHEKHKKTESAIVIENKAAGKPAKDTLTEWKIPCLRMYDPGSNDKMVRVHAIIPFLESGHFYIPDIKLEPRIEEYITQLISFPNASHDDMVDFTTQAILWWRMNKGAYSAFKLGSAGSREAPNRIE